MKKIVALISLIVISTALLGQNGHLRFKGVEINGNYKAFSRELVKKGFVVQEATDHGDILRGDFMGHPNVLTIVYPDSKTQEVVSVGAFLETRDNWQSMLSAFENAVETYKKKYGEPDKYVTEFLDDSFDSDSWKKFYVSEDKCDYNAIWNTEDGGISIQIQYMLGKYGVLILYLDYQNSTIRNEGILEDI